jgi:hypothetical protein
MTSAVHPGETACDCPRAWSIATRTRKVSANGAANATSREGTVRNAVVAEDVGEQEQEDPDRGGVQDDADPTGRARVQDDGEREEDREPHHRGEEKELDESEHAGTPPPTGFGA